MKCSYEAGPTGYVLYWQLTQPDVACEVIAPTLVPVKAGDRMRTDSSDAKKQARCYRGGELMPVWVPDAEHEALRGVAQTTAATMVCEPGNLSRFQSPRQLMGYSGLVPREHSSGGKIQHVAITKTGNAHLRRVLVEAARAYQHWLNVTGFLLRRQKPLTISDEVKQMAWKAQHRLWKRYRALSARGKNKNQIVTALGRELLGFVWAIAVYTEAQYRQTKAA